jgi:hypothetical protein
VTEQEIVMRWQNAEAAVQRLGMHIEVNPEHYRVVNIYRKHPSLAEGANWSFATLDGLLGWCAGIDLGRCMK